MEVETRNPRRRVKSRVQGLGLEHHSRPNLREPLMIALDTNLLVNSSVDAFMMPALPRFVFIMA